MVARAVRSVALGPTRSGLTIANCYVRKVGEEDWQPRLTFALAPAADVDPSLVAGIADDRWFDAEGPLVKATGHVGHPAARTCRRIASPTEDPELERHPATVVHRCRTTFVVTSLEVLP